MSVVALILLSIAEKIGIFIGLRPSHLVKRMTPEWLLNSPLLDVKFSKYLIFVFLLINFSFNHRLSGLKKFKYLSFSKEYPIGYNEIKSDFVKYDQRIDKDRKDFLDSLGFSDED